MPHGTTRTSPQQHSHITTNGRVLSACPGHTSVPIKVARHHEHEVAVGQCCSAMVRTIKAPVDVVWSMVRRFDQPQQYKSFMWSCHIVEGDGTSVGSVRERILITGMPARSSRERLEILDDEQRVISFRILGGENRLFNYRSVTTVHEVTLPSGPATMVVESYVVDVMPRTTAQETCYFIDTIIGINLNNLQSSALD